MKLGYITIILRRVSRRKTVHSHRKAKRKLSRTQSFAMHSFGKALPSKRKSADYSSKFLVPDGRNHTTINSYGTSVSLSSRMTGSSVSDGLIADVTVPLTSTTRYLHIDYSSPDKEIQSFIISFSSFSDREIWKNEIEKAQFRIRPKYSVSSSGLICNGHPNIDVYVMARNIHNVRISY